MPKTREYFKFDKTRKVAKSTRERRKRTESVKSRKDVKIKNLKKDLRMAKLIYLDKVKSFRLDKQDKEREMRTLVRENNGLKEDIEQKKEEMSALYGQIRRYRHQIQTLRSSGTVVICDNPRMMADDTCNRSVIDLNNEGILIHQCHNCDCYACENCDEIIAEHFDCWKCHEENHRYCSHCIHHVRQWGCCTCVRAGDNRTQQEVEWDEHVAAQAEEDSEEEEDNDE